MSDEQESTINEELSRNDIEAKADKTLVFSEPAGDPHDNTNIWTGVPNTNEIEMADNNPAIEQDADVVPDQIEAIVQTAPPRQLYSLLRSPIISIDSPIQMPAPAQPIVIRRRTKRLTKDWKCPPPTPLRQSARISIRRNTFDICPPTPHVPPPTATKNRPAKPAKSKRDKVVGEYHYR